MRGRAGAGQGEPADVIERRARWSCVRGESFAFLQSLPDACADAVVTDPPYSSGGQFRSDRNQKTSVKYVMSGTKLVRPEFAGDNRDQRSFLAWCMTWMAECLRVVRPGGVLMVFSDWRQLPITTDAIQAGGWVWRGIVPWNKVHARPVLGSFTSQCEYVIWGTAGPREGLAEVVLPGFYEFQVFQRDKHHITGKPTPLMRAMTRVLPPDSLVVDPFCGSGTTGVGAMREGHRFLGVEVTEGNHGQAVDRLLRWHVDDEEYRELQQSLRRRPIAATLRR